MTLQGTVFDGGLTVYQETALVRSVEQGRNLADVIGDKPAAFMRGHGIVVVARDVEQMLYASLILEDEAQKWVQASTLGEVQPMSHHDCETFAARAMQPAVNQFKPSRLYCSMRNRRSFPPSPLE